MDDLDQVRQELGYRTINLYGASYGTRGRLGAQGGIPTPCGR